MKQYHSKVKFSARLKGQAMIEYIVILGVLTAALLTAGEGSIGMSKDDEGSLVAALHKRYTTQTHALSISEAPETTNFNDLALYYKSLGKFPKLADGLGEASVLLNKVTSTAVSIDDGIDKLKEYTDPKKALSLIDSDAIKDEVVEEIKNELRDRLIDAIIPI
jgi:Flp pilus assembly pilin Flp